MFATQVLPETCFEQKSEEETNLGSVGFLIVESKEHEVRKGENKIGRDPTICSIVVENFTVSKLHAIIESDGVDETFIYDVGSTNQTKLGKKSLKPHFRYKIDNGTLITLGNVVAKFVAPSVIEDGSKSTEKSTDTGGNVVGCDVLNELGDIFDIATQVDISQPSTSKAMTKFERVPDNFQLFKVPSPLTQCKEKNVCPGTSKIWSETMTQSETNLKISSKSFIALEDPSIFSLTTQCQLPEHLTLSEPNKLSENEKSDADKLKSLLSDGEDDVFCSLVVIHSPGGNSQQKELRIKTEVIEDNLDEIFDVPTQVPLKSEPKESTKSEKIKQEVNECFEKDFQGVIKQEHSQDPCQMCGDKNSAVEKIAEQGGEDAGVQEKETQKNSKSGEENLSQNSSYLEITLEDIEVENDEDIILTQKFECLEKNKELRRNQEDWEETQVYDVKNTTCPEVIENVPKISSLVVLESSDDDTESDLEILLHSSTQRNKDEDFISTQLFGSRQSENKEGKDVGTERATQSRSIIEPVEDDEDFIATQIRGNPEQQETNIRSPRESSPDLLSGCPRSYAEDFTCTQAFEMEEPKPDIRTESIESILFRGFGAPEEDEPRVESKVPPPSIPTSSGDETESDLEIILTDTEYERAKNKSSPDVKKESRDEISEGDRLEDGDSNSSYVFQLEQTRVETTKEVLNVTDSDATDCEEISAINMTNNFMPCEKEADETFDRWVEKSETANDYREEESQKFELEEVHSMSIPETQEVDTRKMLKRGDGEFGKERTEETEVRVKSSGCLENKTKGVDSPVKRIRTEDNITEVVPTKKSRNAQNVEDSGRNTERRFTRLWQTHDMSHIQTTRTRNSVKNVESEKKTNSTENNKRRPNRKSSSGNSEKARKSASRKSEGRKSVCVGREKDDSAEDFLMKPNSPEVKNVSRILRSARRKSGGLALSNSFDSSLSSSSIRNCLRRNSRTKSERPYFGSSSVNVVFTGFECEHLEKIISDLGGKKSQNLSCGEVVVTDKVRRTVKFLCAVGSGLPIASPKWLLSCREENKFVDPWDYILRDEESEEKWDFDLRCSLERAKKTKLLRGFSVYATERTKPPVRDLLAIVECCGGVPLFERPEIWPKKTVVVSCMEDKDSWPPPKLRHVKIVHYEFILSGALKQKIDFKTYNLK